MMKNDKLMTMKKTGLQNALRTSKMGTGATLSSLTPCAVYPNPPTRTKPEDFSKPSLIVVHQDPSVLL